MADRLALDQRIDRLRTRGDAHDNTDWASGETDYVAEYSLTADEFPALISLAQWWCEEVGDDDPENEDNAVYGPVHAWRALGQLRAVAAIEPLLDILDRLAGLHDDWYLEEFPDVFALIGPPAIAPLSAFLADASHREYSRVCAADSLRHIAERSLETRAEVVAILTTELARHDKGFGDLNGLLVGNLLDLQAVESAEAIERAFAAGIIDPTIAGDWGYVREELGLPGLGIAPDHDPRWPTSRGPLGWVDHSRDFARIDPPDGKSRSSAKHEARAKKKAERKNKKKNRKSR